MSKNEIKLQSEAGFPVDENLRPILVGGKATSIETAQMDSGARIRGDLHVTGSIKGKTDIQLTDDITCDDITCDSIVINNMTIDGTEIDLSSGDLTIDVSGDITLDADGGNITLQDGGSTYTPKAASDAVTKTYGDTQTVINNTTYVRAHNLTWYLFAGDQAAWLGGTDTSVSDTETISLSRAVLDTLWFIVPYNMTIHAISGSVCDDDMSAHTDKYIGIWTIDSLSTSGNDPGDVGGSQAFTLRYITAAFGGTVAYAQAFHDTGADFALTAGQGVFLGYRNAHSGGLDDVTLNCTIWAHQTTP